MDAFNTNIASLLIWIELKLVDLISQTQCQIKDVSNSKKKKSFFKLHLLSLSKFFFSENYFKGFAYTVLLFFLKKIKVSELGSKL